MRYDKSEIGTEKPIKMSELKKGEYFRTMTMGELLPLLEKENEL